MNPASEDIKELLEDAGLGLTLAVNLFIAKEPSEPDNCVTVFDTPGMAPLATLDGAKNFFHSSIQVRVRNISYVTAYSLIERIVLALHGRGPESVGGATYCSIICTTDPSLLDWDENGRVRLITNFNITRKT